MVVIVEFGSSSQTDRMSITSVFLSAAGAVGMVFLIAAAGIMLSSMDVLDESGLSDLSDLLFYLLYPCLVFTKISSSLEPGDVLELWILPAVAVCYMSFGFLIAWSARTAGLINVPQEFQQGSVAAVTWANGGYLPLALFSALAVTVPEIAQRTNAETIGHSYIAVYILSVSFTMWTVCYPYLGGGDDGMSYLKRVLNPPLFALILALTVSMIPGLSSMFELKNPVISGLLKGLTIMGDAAVPVSIIVLGGNLWFAARSSDQLPFTQVSLLSGLRLLVVPCFAIGLYFLMDRVGLLPEDPILQVVILLESITPTAIGVLIMCQLHDRAQTYLAYLQFWMYSFSLLTMILWLSLFIWIVY